MGGFLPGTAVFLVGVGGFGPVPLIAALTADLLPGDAEMEAVASLPLSLDRRAGIFPRPSEERLAGLLPLAPSEDRLEASEGMLVDRRGAGVTLIAPAMLSAAAMLLVLRRDVLREGGLLPAEGDDDTADGPAEK